MSVYYIDPINGREANDGLSSERPRRDHRGLALLPDDQVLFRRGTLVRGSLEVTPHVSYGAYGEGDLPTFCGSIDVGAVSDWQQTERKNVWKCTKSFRGEVGNIIFNTSQCTAALRWSAEELCEQGDFCSTAEGSEHAPSNRTEMTSLLLYSVGNPAEVYDAIEVAEHGDRCIVRLKDGVTLENIRIINSGVHGMAGQGDGISVRRCVFENIGGCPWDRKARIRFGNGLEIWHHGNDILVEHCVFKNIYDSCVTHQGPGKDTAPTEDFICRHCTFDTYGMAAFEYRDKLPIRSVFAHNTCLNAGCGFAMLGEQLPRNSEIWPQPMGHHIFLWRIPEPSDGGGLEIFDNIFGPAPVGAAIYSIISASAEAQIALKNNQYTPNNTLLFCFGGKSYTSLADFKEQTGQDAGSRYAFERLDRI